MEGRLRFFDLKDIFLAHEILEDLLFLHRMFAHSQHDRFAHTRHHNRILQQDWIRILLLVLLDISVATLLHAHFEASDVRIELLLIDAHVHFLEQ